MLSHSDSGSWKESFDVVKELYGSMTKSFLMARSM